VSDLNDIRHLAKTAGIILPDTVRSINKSAAEFAMDADLAPTQVTASNAGIPAWLTTFFDPRPIKVHLAPVRAAEIHGEVKKGDYTTDTAIFRTVEHGGTVATYGDYSTNGTTSANTTYPSREVFRYQTWVQYGDLELAQAGAGMIDLAGDLQESRAIVMAKFANKAYLYGIAGLENYGLTNDPSLTAPVAAPVNYATAAPEDIANDFIRMKSVLISNSNGLIDGTESMVFATAPTVLADLDRINGFNTSPREAIMRALPNLRFVAVPEYDTPAGRLGQLWVESIDGQKTAELGFTEKMRAGRVEAYSTHMRQKFMGGTWGAVIYQPYAVTQTLGL